MRKRCKFCGKILYNEDPYRRVKTPAHHLAFEPVCPGCFKSRENEVEEFDPATCVECGNDAGNSMYISELGTSPDLTTNVYVKHCQDCIARGIINKFIHVNFLMLEDEVADIDALLMKKKHVIGTLEMMARHAGKAFPGNHLCLSIDEKKENVLVLNDATDERMFDEITSFVKHVTEHVKIASDGMTPIDLLDACEGCPKRETCPDRDDALQRKA